MTHAASKHTPLPGPDDVLRKVLPNGIRVLARENWSAPSVVVEGYVVAGSLDEPQDTPGLASFTASMLSRGTEKRTFTAIHEAIEAVGAAIGFSTDRYVTSFSTKSLVEDLDLVMEILADELRNPAFPAEYIQRVRGARLTAIAERENDTRQMAGLAFRELLYGANPLGRDLLGTRESNMAIDRTMLATFYDTYYSPEEMTVVVVGALPAEEALTRVARAFADWPKSRPARAAIPSVPRPATRAEQRVSMPGKSQSDIVLGWPSMRRLSPDYDAARLANTVLGVFGMMGRLGTTVREEQGMAYYAYSRLGADREPGSWAATAGVNPANVERAIESILVEVNRLREEPVPADELLDVKSYLTGSLPLQLETNDGVASILSDIEWHELGLDYVERYSAMIHALTAEEVQAAACKYMDPEAFALSVAGPASG
jgi:zinc protease